MPNDMDAAAEAAEQELQGLLGIGASAEDVAAWWKKHYLNAGHKRLGRILVKIAKENEE